MNDFLSGTDPNNLFMYMFGMDGIGWSAVTLSDNPLISAVLAIGGVMLGVKLVQLAIRKVRGAVA